MSGKWKSKVGTMIKVQQVGNLLKVPTQPVEEEEDVEVIASPDVLRRFSFESPEEKRVRRNKKQGLYNQLAEVEIDINDVAEKDDDDISDMVSTMVAHVLNSVYFKGMIFVVIAINAVHIALQTVNSIAIPYSAVFSFIDNLIMGIFICEIVLKWYSGFIIFWKDYWNILDFVIIFVLHLGPWLKFFSNTRLLRILRVIRAFRSLKTVTSLTGLSLVVETILQSIPDMANIMVLLLIFMVVLSVVGVKLFAKFVPQYFGDPVKCMFSIFVCFTQDGWMQIFRNFERYAEDDTFTYVSACFFFLLTILTAAFIIANLIVAVVTTNLDRAMKEMKEEQRANRQGLGYTKPEDGGSGAGKKPGPEAGRENATAKPGEGEEEVLEVPVVHLEEVLDSVNPSHNGEVIKQQRPLFKCDLSHITTEKLEDYFLLLIALDENLKEHKRLREVVTGIVKTVRGLNENAGGDVEAAKLLIGQKKSMSIFDISSTSFGGLMDRSDSPLQRNKDEDKEKSNDQEN